MSNWEKLQQKLTTVAAVGSGNKKRKFDSKKENKQHSSSADAALRKGFSNVGGDKSKDVGKHPDLKTAKDNETIMSILDAKAAKIPEHVRAKYVGLDCEMVGIGPSGKCSVLARCCMTSFTGEVLYDEFVRPSDFVTDFRTEYSGVRKRDLRTGVAISLLQCQKDVAAMLKGKILVGHALHNDLKVLLLSHPHTHIRDTARYKFYMRPHGKKGGKFKPRALRDLSKQHLKLVIQQGEHDPSIDAKCAMNLYRMQMSEWESSLRSNGKRATTTTTDSTSKEPHGTVSTTTTAVDSESDDDAEDDNEDNDNTNESDDDNMSAVEAAAAVTSQGDFVRSNKKQKK